VEEQVCVIYAGTRGYLDKIPTSAVSRFEQEFLARLHSQHKDLLDAIRTKKALDDALEGQLKAALDSFSSTFA
jgi:F-type H+-transporting ATPase subunit alpha